MAVNFGSYVSAARRRCTEAHVSLRNMSKVLRDSRSRGNQIIGGDEPNAERDKQQHWPEALPVLWQGVNERHDANDAEKEHPRDCQYAQMRQHGSSSTRRRPQAPLES